MGVLIGLIVGFAGIFGFIACLVGLVIALATKKTKYGWLIGIGVSALCLLVGLFIIGKSDSGEGNSNKKSDTKQEQGSDSDFDLTGEWKQTNSNSKDSYQAAYIHDDTIEIYWVNESSGTISLYWAGTFESPQKSTSEYTWESENDTTRTNSALLASSDETKLFKYKNGVISYSASAFGATTTIKLKMEDWAYTDYQIPTQNSSSASLNGRIVDAGNIGDFYVEINPEFTITQNRYGETVIVLSFNWRNDSSETTHASVEFDTTAFQDGIELDRSYDSSLLDNDNDSKDIRPGAQITVDKAFVLGNISSPVEFEVSEWLSWGDTAIIYKNFNIQE